jgi:hypothetical protein
MLFLILNTPSNVQHPSNTKSAFSVTFASSGFSNATIPTAEYATSLSILFPYSDTFGSFDVFLNASGTLRHYKILLSSKIFLDQAILTPRTCRLFHVSPEVTTLGTLLFVLGFGFGPLVSMPTFCRT